MPLLAHDVVGDGPVTVLLLHGILGSANNWLSFAKKLVAACPRSRVVLADLRNHGESHGFSAPHTMDACTADVQALSAHLAEQGHPVAVVVGHSFGGKVALAFAGTRPAHLEACWILDSPPGPRRWGNGSDVERVIDAVRDVPMPLPTRQALVDDLLGRGLSEGLAKWMTTNLRPVSGGLGWRFQLDAIPEMLQSFGALDLWPVVFGGGPVRLVLVRGGRSDRFSAEERAQIVRATATGALVEHVLPDAGHWLHVEDADGLLSLLASDPCCGGPGSTR